MLALDDRRRAGNKCLVIRNIDLTLTSITRSQSADRTVFDPPDQNNTGIVDEMIHSEIDG